jgi:hypothetical protein
MAPRRRKALDQEYSIVQPLSKGRRLAHHLAIAITASLAARGRIG